MEQDTQQIITARRHWRAMAKDSGIMCDSCDNAATSSSSRISSDDIILEVHWHCDMHSPSAT